MPNKQNDYLQALDNLQNLTSEIEQEFLNKANNEGKLPNESVPDLLDGLVDILNIDLDDAKEFFSLENENITKYFELELISFQDFMELIKMWLQKKSSEKPKQNEETNILAESNDNFENNTQEDDNDEENDHNSNVEKAEENEGKNLPKNYNNNRNKMNELLLKHKENFLERFQQIQDSDTETISFQDYFCFLQDCFSLDSVYLFENKTDEQDFFSADNSHKRLEEIAEKYFIEVKGVEAEDFNIKETPLTFNECFDILDFWFQNDNNVFLSENNGKQQPNSQSNIQSDVKSLIKETIEKYEKLIKESRSEIEKEILQATLDTLLQKLNQLERRGSNTVADESRLDTLEDKKAIKRKERRMKALKEIFDFYSKQQLNGGKAATFDRIGKQFNSINIGKFSVIIKNFQMKIDQLKLKETFKKIATNSEVLSFEEFVALFQKIAKDVELIKEVKVVKPNYEIMKEYKPDSYKKSPVPKITHTRSDSSNKRYTRDQYQAEQNKLEEMWDHMGLYDGKYRNGLLTVQLAFNSHEKETFRIPPEGINYKFKLRGGEGKSILEMKEEIFNRNELRKVTKDLKAFERSLLKNHRGTPSKSTPRLERTLIEKKETSASYANLKTRKSRPVLTETKLTLKEVLKSNYSDIKGARLTRFNPNDLIEENDEEDNLYLAEYKLKNDKKEEKVQNDTKKNENYENYNLKKSRAPGKYSYITPAPYRAGTVVSKLTNETSVEKKPATLSDFDYENIAKSTPLMYTNNKSNLLGASQSVKHQYGVQNLRNIHVEANYMTNNHSNPPLKIQKTNVQPSEVFAYLDQYRKANAVLDRAQQIHQNSKKREQEIMNNIVNQQNNKLEQGLRIARK